MKRTTLVLLLLGLGLGGSWFTRNALRARTDRVTLDVRDMPLAEVVRLMERQTWETILVPRDLEGQVTLNVRRMPLADALRLVADQVSARALTVVALYRRSDALNDLSQKVIAGDTAPSGRWTNFSARAGAGPVFAMGGGVPGRDSARSAASGAAGNDLLTLSFQAKPISDVARAVSRAGGVVVVPEDTLHPTITLELTRAPLNEAVTALAQAARAKSSTFYALQTSRRPERDREAAPEIDPEEREARIARRLETMSPEQRERAESFLNLSPEERQAQREARLQDPGVSQQMAERMNNDLRTSTPEQRVDRYRQMKQRQTRARG